MGVVEAGLIEEEVLAVEVAAETIQGMAMAMGFRRPPDSTTLKREGRVGVLVMVVDVVLTFLMEPVASLVAMEDNLEIMGVSLVAMVMEVLVLAAVMGDNSTTTVNFLGGRWAMGINLADSILVRILLMAGTVEVIIGVVLIFVVLLPIT